MEEKAEFRPKRFAVIGAGPVGCILGAYLAKGGHEVALVDVVAELVDPALSPGIRIEGDENFQQSVSAVSTNIDQLGKNPPDVIFVAVKANANALLASAIEGFQKKDMVVISWQNGIDTELVLAEMLGKTPVMRAVVNYGCGLIAPAHVRMPFHHPPHFIQELDPESGSKAQSVAEILTDCGLPTVHTDQIVSKVWRKAILNACMNPVCAVTGLTMSRSMTDPIVFKIVDALIKECVKVARANEIMLGWDFYPHAIQYMSTAGNHKPSMLMDIEAKRRTEIDFINGKFVEYGQQAGIETPYNDAILALVKGLESSI